MNELVRAWHVADGEGHEAGDDEDGPGSAPVASPSQESLTCDLSYTSSTERTRILFESV
ncbi:hypothetical protein WME98_10150 [Sorangium sp. So ce296]|uniref:hypothetical protein n=1 Tax=Sorangium sp. So ce296 TaxID=3133296 RepID=UPI003F5F7613